VKQIIHFNGETIVMNDPDHDVKKCN
jgi:hypothetical protein